MYYVDLPSCLAVNSALNKGKNIGKLILTTG